MRGLRLPPSRFSPLPSLCRPPPVTQPSYTNPSCPALSIYIVGRLLLTDRPESYGYAVGWKGHSCMHAQWVFSILTSQILCGPHPPVWPPPACARLPGLGFPALRLATTATICNTTTLYSCRGTQGVRTIHNCINRKPPCQHHHELQRNT